MTPQELRAKLLEGGVSNDTPFEKALNVLIEYMLKLEDPPAHAYDMEEEPFVLGFCAGAAAMGMLIKDIEKRRMQ